MGRGPVYAGSGSRAERRYNAAFIQEKRHPEENRVCQPAGPEPGTENYSVLVPFKFDKGFKLFTRPWLQNIRQIQEFPQNPLFKGFAWINDFTYLED